jgi:uncharacterized membrane protein
MLDGTAARSGGSTRYKWAGYALGFSIGGFFDGILLHQVLQWHHLLSGLQGAPFDDLRFQILADGLFHALMYVVGGIGLWLLWRSRREIGAAQGDRLLVACALIGFGTWHIIDGIVSHWMLGIHRIKMDSEVPLAWDLAWFVVFGVVFVAWGFLLRRKGPGSPGRSHTTAASLAVLAVACGTVSLAPPARTGDTTTLVVFLPWTSPAQAMSATTNIGGRLVWSDRHDGVWAIDLPEGADRTVLYRAGALLVSGTLMPAGCLNWFEKPGGS